jgi:hypothetical protein
MKTHRTAVAEPKGKVAAQPACTPTHTLLDQYECGPVALCGTPDASYERHLNREASEHDPTLHVGRSSGR